MVKYAKGKKSNAISDISGLRVRYTQLRTTWDGLRVSPEDFDPKQPQLTPAKNVVDDTALFNPRPDNDPENVTFFVGYNYDPFLDPRDRPSVGVNSYGNVGLVNLEITHTTQTGVGGTGGVGTENVVIDQTRNVTGLGATGGVGVEIPAAFPFGVGGSGGAGAVGVEGVSLAINEVGVGGTGGVGTESIGISGWGQSTWGSGTWGN